MTSQQIAGAHFIARSGDSVSLPMKCLTPISLVLALSFGGAWPDAVHAVSPLASIVRNASDDQILTSILPFARIARYAYADAGSAEQLPTGIVQIGSDFRSSTTGLLAKTFRATTGEIIVSFAGTSLSRPGSLLADLELVAGTVPEQFVEAENYVKKTRSEFPDAEICLVGHSLGGAEAILVGQKLKLNAIAFNAPWLSDRLWNQIPSAHRQSFRDGPWYLNFQSSGDRTTVLGIDRDFVSTARLWKEAAVEVIPVKTGCDLDVLCHSIEHFCPSTPQ